jgi:hypothetical protein
VGLLVVPPVAMDVVVGLLVVPPVAMDVVVGLLVVPPVAVLAVSDEPSQASSSKQLRLSSRFIWTFEGSYPCLAQQRDCRAMLYRYRTGEFDQRPGQSDLVCSARIIDCERQFEHQGFEPLDVGHCPRSILQIR